MKKIIGTLSGISGIVALAQPAFAQGSLTTITLTNSGGGVTNLGTLISAGFNMAIIIAILFVFVMLILGGYGWLSAGGDKAKVEEARTRITNALIGMAVIASAWVIITIVAQFFGVDWGNLDLPTAAENVTPGTGGGGTGGGFAPGP